MKSNSCVGIASVMAALIVAATAGEAQGGNAGAAQAPVTWGRHADVTLCKDGWVLISDDQKGVICRVYR